MMLRSAAAAAHPPRGAAAAVEGIVQQLAAIRRELLDYGDKEIDWRALRLLAHVARHKEAAAQWGRWLEQRGAASHAVALIPSAWEGVIRFRLPDDVLRTLAEVATWERAAGQAWKTSSLEWLWTEEIPSACAVQAAKEWQRGVFARANGERVVTYYPYRHRVALGPSETNDLSRLARLWAREAPRLSETARALAEERLRATEVGGQILWRARLLDDAAKEA